MRKILVLTLLIFVGLPVAHAGEAPVRVYAAASLSAALTTLAGDWQQSGHATPTLVLAGTGTLAKQVIAGAPADIFIAADQAWMNRLEASGKLVPNTRRNLLGNSLVLIAPVAHPFAVRLQKDFDLASAFEGKLCTGEPDAVPLGTYARQSLHSLGWWQGLEGRIVGSDDALTALNFVARGECAAGVVYATDAQASKGVRVLATLPAGSHSAIVYPTALIQGHSAEAAQFFEFLTRSPEAHRLFLSYGFSLLSEPGN